MRLKSLYLKIFLSFLGILLLTEILIMVFFVLGVGRHFKENIETYTGSKVRMAKVYIEDMIRASAGLSLSKDPDRPVDQELNELIKRVGRIYGAKVWIEDVTGNPLAKSFEGDIPGADSFHTQETAGCSNRVKIRKSRRTPWEYYYTAPLTLPGGQSGFLHLVFKPDMPNKHQPVFFIGLIIIGAVVALLTFPVSRLITKPVNRLRRSAIRIADGELSHRARIETRDEIGQLGRTFNHMADRLSEMIRGGKELTANVSHELRSPLARIRVAEELIRRKAEQEGFQGLTAHLDNIKEDIEEQDRIIERIMILSKMDLSEEPLKLVEADLVDLVEAVLERFTPLTGRNRLKMLTEFTWKGRILLDPQAFTSAVSNLMDNAVKFTPPGGRVRIGIFREGGNLVMSFSNTTAGPPPINPDMLFEPFQKSERSQGGGTGLGLAIVRKIMMKHGGNVSAESTADLFTVRMALPLEG